ncbi:MAG: Ig-like domain-containing protein [Lachnospiraceae bacterium]|nr:Ig-like domain-containing protein [Lachnospiraceae bacterium]
MNGYDDKFSVTWMSSNNEVATVEDGVVNAVIKGSAKITAYVGGKAFTCNVKVVDTTTMWCLSSDAISSKKNGSLMTNF